MNARNVIKAILARLAEIKADERYQSGRRKPANVMINAPLALVQLALEVEHDTLAKVLMMLRGKPTT